MWARRGSARDIEEEVLDDTVISDDDDADGEGGEWFMLRTSLMTAVDNSDLTAAGRVMDVHPFISGTGQNLVDTVAEPPVTTPPRRPSQRSGSMSSPPLPPPLYNPPADKLASPTISPPSSISSSANSSTMSISQQLSASSHDVSLAAAAAVAASRPRLDAIQRISSDSINSVGTPESARSAASTLSAGSVSSPASDGEAHLIEARELLMSGSGDTSRRESLSTDGADSMERELMGPELNIISPTPPMQPVGLGVRDALPEAGPSHLRRSSSPPPPEADGHDLPAEHAWDSVWPAPGSSHRHPYASEVARPHFPTAPVSPFVTPSFSPAIIPTTSIPRRPPSPIHTSDPLSPNRLPASPSVRSSPRERSGSNSRSPVLPAGLPEDFNMVRRRSITSPGPLLTHSPPTSASISINKHQRSLSASSPSYGQKSFHGSNLDRIQQTPPGTPPASPGRRNKVDAPRQTDSANGSTIRKGTAAPRPGSDRLADISAIPDLSLVSPKPTNRPRGKSLSSLPPPELAESISRPDSPRPHPAVSPGMTRTAASSSLPSISLPPAVAPAPVLLPGGDDGLPQPSEALAFLASPLPVAPPIFAPLSRPATLRRAMSDYDPAAKNRAVPPLNRSISITAELDKSPKRHGGAADVKSPLSPRLGGDLDLTRVRKSPRRSPGTLPVPDIADDISPLPPLETDLDINEDPTAVQLVDEGDVLPNMDFQMDVTFDDEGLNTLERIFLLSKSDFPFHRAYVARVLGDLLSEVDPCESVEYVLPLLSGFSMDEDESVKEAFASELHRILWYFYSTCKLMLDEDEIAGVEYKPMSETVTVTSEGVDVVPKSAPEPEMTPSAAYLDRRRGSVLSGMSTAGSTSSSMYPSSSSPSTATGSAGVDTPASTISEATSQSTAYSPDGPVLPHADDMDPEKGWAKDAGPLVEQPPLAVNFFTPLLGSLLLNQNPTISDSVRNGVVHIIGRLRGRVEPAPGVWGSGVTSMEVDERRVFASQTGPHSHDLRPFSETARRMVEEELLLGIVIGMGQLSTEMPEGIFTEPDDVNRELFQEQLVIEATAGRATSMNLIGSLCEFYDAHEVVEAGFIDEVLRSGDGDVSVRAEGAVALSSLAKTAPTDEVYALIPLFELLLEDETEHVKQSVCLALPSLCKRIEDPAYRRDFAVRAVSALAASGDDVRCAMCEMLGEIIHVFAQDPAGPPQELLEVYIEDVAAYAGLDGDWDVVAAFNFPGVALTLGSKRWDEIRPLYERLQVRAGDKIMRILAASLHELAKILEPKQVEEDLLPVYRRCITCNDEIRERVYEHVDVIISQVEPDVGWTVFQDLAASWKDGSLGGWRAREQLALHLPKCLEMFREEEKGTQVLDVLRDALLDPFAAVRDGVTKGIPEAYAVLGDDSPVAVKFRNMLLELSASPMYRRRLTFVRCLREFIRPPPNQHAFENFFVPSLARLSKDVVDIRLGLAQAIADLFVVGAYYGKETGPVPQEIRDLAQYLYNDVSTDVQDTLRNVQVDRLHRGKGLPHTVQPSAAPDRSLKPEDDGFVSREMNGSPASSSDHLAPPAHSNSADSSTSSSSSSSSTIRGSPAGRPGAEVFAKLDDMSTGAEAGGRDFSAEWKEGVESSAVVDSPSPSFGTAKRPSLDPFSASFSQATASDMSSTPKSMSPDADAETPRM